MSNYIVSLGVGWLALLILTWGQCEGLNIGIGTEELTPTSFFISITKLIINAELGSGEANLNFSTMEKLKKGCLYAVSFYIGGTRHEAFERFIDGEDANAPSCWVWGVIRNHLRKNKISCPVTVSDVMVFESAEPIWSADIYDITDNNPDEN